MDFPHDFFGSIVFFLRIPDSDFSRNKSFEKAVCDSSKIDPCYFHVGILSENTTLIHSTVSLGVVEQNLLEVIENLKPDYIEFCEVEVDDSRKRSAVRFASEAVGFGYNDLFSPENINSKGQKSFYCCQLVAQAYGRELFNAHKLNFKDKEGKLIDFWIHYFDERNRTIPQVSFSFVFSGFSCQMLNVSSRRRSLIKFL